MSKLQCLEVMVRPLPDSPRRSSVKFAASLRRALASISSTQLQTLILTEDESPLYDDRTSIFTYAETILHHSMIRRRSLEGLRRTPSGFLEEKGRLGAVMDDAKFGRLQEVKIILRSARRKRSFAQQAKNIEWMIGFFSVWNKRGILVFE